MMWLRAARAVGIISLASVVVAPKSRTERSAGLTFDYSTAATTQPAGPNGAGAFSMTGRGIATSAGSTRIDVIATEGVSLYKVGDYLVVINGKTSLVHPDTKTYVDLDAQANNIVKNMPPALLAQMTITNITGAAEKVSGDEQLDGRSTEHHRTNLGYAMNVMGTAIPSTVVMDIWLAKLPFKIALPVSGGSKKPEPGPMAEMMQKQYDIIPRPEGFTLIKSSTGTTSSIMGQTVGSNIVAEMKNIKEGDVDASRFVVPSDFAKADK
ncbi:MAG: hypothetical protein ABJC26_05645 [Gemmatimonadaceae bacterium]